MDSKRVHDAKYLQQLFEIYQRKFQNHKFDVIISSDNNAFNFLRRHRDELFPKTPVVFCGVNNFQDSMLENQKLFTGTVEAIDIKETLDIALTLHPQTKKIIIYGDNSPTYLANLTLFKKIIPSYEKKSLEFIFSEKPQLNISEIQKHIQILSPDSLIFLINTLRDQKGHLLSFENSAEMIARESKAPLYGFWDFFLGHGIVGGKLTSGFAQGQTAAQMALRILAGVEIGNIGVLKTSPNRFMFDYNQLQRFGIKLSQLPNSSIIINQPSSLYVKHKNLVWIAVGALSGLTLIILFFAIYSFRLKQTKHLLQDSEKNTAPWPMNPRICAIEQIMRARLFLFLNQSIR